MQPDLKPLIELSEPSTALGWMVVNDDVMGGVSSGRLRVDNGRLNFTGELSLANNGGFASVRTRNWGADLTGVKALWVRVKGDGRQWQLRLTTEARFRRSPVSYSQPFQTEAERWVDVRLPLADFVPSYRGTQLQGPPLDRSQIRELGFLLGDAREEPFKIAVEWVRTE